VTTNTDLAVKPKAIRQGYRQCTKCGQEKPDNGEHFVTAYGKTAQPCRICDKHAKNERRAANPELARQKDRERFERDREKIQGRKKVAYARNPERAKENAKQWRLANPERAKENAKRNYLKRDRAEENARLREYNRLNPEKRRAHVMKRTALRKGTKPIWNPRIWQECLNYWKRKCCICGRPEGLWHLLAQEHWIAMVDPRPDNPQTVPWNMLPMCHSKQGANGMGDCNHSKSKKDPIEWLFSQYSHRRAKQILKRIEVYFALTKVKYSL